MTVTLGVLDLEKTAEFYDEVLGFSLKRFIPLPGHPPVLLLRRGEGTVLFRKLSALEAMHPALFQNLSRHPRGVGMTLNLTVDDLPALLRRMDRHHVHCLYELEDEEHHRQEVWVHDPDGYLIILSQEAGEV